MGLYVVVTLAFGLICGLISAAIAGRKNRNTGGFFALGFFLGLIGIVAAAIASPGSPATPPGLTAVICPRCNARQNVPTSEETYRCWQCALDGPLVPAAGATVKVKTEQQQVEGIGRVAILLSMVGLFLSLLGGWGDKGVSAMGWLAIPLGLVGAALGVAILVRGMQLSQHDAWMARAAVIAGCIPVVIVLGHFAAGWAK